jgi:Phage Mu protein F like protein
MMNPRILVALETMLAVLRARTPGTPAGDADDEHEDNTFDLPEGRPLRRQMKRWYRRQMKTILGTLPTIGAPLPDRFLPLSNYNDPMASAMTPILSSYWDEAGKETRARLGLDPEAWEVHDPHLHDVIKDATLAFCESTNATTDTDLSEALEQLRQEFLEGLVDRGDTIPELTRRVQKVFKQASEGRAERIARTEASRAVHSASLMSAKESGVVAGKKWLVSANSCDKCKAIAAELNKHGIGLDDEFANSGSNANYASITNPPLHPHCRCSITYALTPEYEELLAEHGPPEPAGWKPGELGPEVKPRKIAKKGKRPKKELDLSELDDVPDFVPGPGGNFEYPLRPLSPEEVIPPRPTPDVDLARKPKPLDWTQVVDYEQPEYREHGAGIDQRHDHFFDFLAHNLGMNPSEAQRKLEQAMQSAADAGEPYKRMDFDSLRGALEDKRIKSQFETGTSEGTFNPPLRSFAEQRVMGTPESVWNSRRPVYGLLSEPDFAGFKHGLEEGSSQYGDAVVRFQPWVKQRATMTIGDSLDLGPMLQASRLDAVSHRSFPSEFLMASPSSAMTAIEHPGDGLANLKLFRRKFAYVELQYHGGLRLNAVRDVMFLDDPDDDLVRLLAERGIAWRRVTEL